MSRKLLYTDGSSNSQSIEIPFVGTRRALFSIDCVHLDVKRVFGREYAWAVANIKQTERMDGSFLPSVWFPGTYGMQCDVLYYDDERIFLKSGVTVFELVKV